LAESGLDSIQILRLNGTSGKERGDG
jgi:aryl carrier-like protein